MSLEAKIEALTAAVEANTAALLGGAAPKAAGKATSKTEDKPATKAAGAKKKGLTMDVVAEAFGAYLNSGPVAAKKKAKEVVKGIVEHFGAERVSKIEHESLQEAMDLLAAYKDGEDPLELFGDSDEDDDGMV